MSESRVAHDWAMDLTFLADRAKAAGDLEEAGRLYKQALESELAALEALQKPTSMTLASATRTSQPLIPA